MKTTRRVLLVMLGVSGFLLFIACCSFNPLFQVIMHAKMNQMLALAPNSYSFHFWKYPPVPVMFELYVFDITNPDEVRQGQAPSLVEKGPYTYRAVLEKFDIKFNDNYTVTYRQRQTFFFDREKSVGWDNETFTTVNAPLFTVASLMQYEFPFLKEAVNLLLEGLDEKPLITVSVSDIFWGYEDPFLHLVKELLDKLHLKSKFITGIFGFYMDRNATDDGLYTVHTGKDDLSKFLLIERWNGLKMLDYWSTPIANMINGTDGSLYPPFLTTDRVLQMYDSNLYRSLNMVFKADSSVMGIPTMKFIVEDNQFANATVNLWNAGFCIPLNHCIPSGLINCSSMGHGAPMYVSLPHFLDADPYYFRLVEGLHPNEEKHRPFFDVHQLTGASLSAGRRYQLNLQTKEYSFLTKTHGFSLAYVPVLWLNGMATVDQSVADIFENQIEIPLKIITVVHYVMYGISAIMALIPVVIFLRLRYIKKKKTSENGNLQEQASQNGVSEVQASINGPAAKDQQEKYGVTEEPNERTLLLNN